MNESSPEKAANEDIQATFSLPEKLVAPGNSSPYSGHSRKSYLHRVHRRPEAKKESDGRRDNIKESMKSILGSDETNKSRGTLRSLSGGSLSLMQATLLKHRGKHQHKDRKAVDRLDDPVIAALLGATSSANAQGNNTREGRRSSWKNHLSMAPRERKASSRSRSPKGILSSSKIWSRSGRAERSIDDLESFELSYKATDTLSERGTRSSLQYYSMETNTSNLSEHRNRTGLVQSAEVPGYRSGWAQDVIDVAIASLELGAYTPCNHEAAMLASHPLMGSHTLLPTPNTPTARATTPPPPPTGSPAKQPNCSDGYDSLYGIQYERNLADSSQESSTPRTEQTRKKANSLRRSRSPRDGRAEGSPRGTKSGASRSRSSSQRARPRRRRSVDPIDLVKSSTRMQNSHRRHRDAAQSLGSSRSAHARSTLPDDVLTSSAGWYDMNDVLHGSSYIVGEGSLSGQRRRSLQLLGQSDPYGAGDSLNEENMSQVVGENLVAIGKSLVARGKTLSSPKHAEKIRKGFKQDHRKNPSHIREKKPPHSYSAVNTKPFRLSGDLASEVALQDDSDIDSLNEADSTEMVESPHRFRRRSFDSNYIFANLNTDLDDSWGVLQLELSPTKPKNTVTRPSLQRTNGTMKLPVRRTKSADGAALLTSPKNRKGRGKHSKGATGHGRLVPT